MVEVDRAPGIRPRPTLARRLDTTARACFPTACTTLLMLAAAVPLGLPLQAALLPALTLASVWFWSLSRPVAMPSPVVFLLGVLFDLLGYLPLGVGVLTLLVLHGLALRCRRPLARRGALFVWLAFAGVAAGATGLIWGLASLLLFRLLPVPPAIFQLALTAAVYPALATLSARAHRSVADPGRA